MTINLSHPILMNNMLTDAQSVELRIKFCSINEEERRYIVQTLVNDFIVHFEDYVLIKIEDDNGKKIKLNKTEQYLLKRKKECSIVGGMIVKKGLDSSLISYAKAEKYFDNMLDLNDEEETDDYPSNRAGLLPRSRFVDDESFLEYNRKCFEKDFSIKTKAACNDLSFLFMLSEGKQGIYNGEFVTSCMGYTVDYRYSEMLEFWKSLVFRIGYNVKNILATISLVKSDLQELYVDMIRDGIVEKYNMEPSEICLLDNIGWFNYVPKTILKGMKKTNDDSNVIIQEKKNGISISLTKEINNLNTVDLCYLRKNYLDQYLLKARDVLDEDIDEYSVLKNEGEMYPIYEEELFMKKTYEYGEILYGIEFIPREE